MSDITLLIMAAGMGSRYGGLKQLDSVGPNQETIIDYSVYDAIRAGFGKVVFVIRKEFETPFRARFDQFSNRINIEYVFQPVNVAVEGLDIIKREKPWGTTPCQCLRWRHAPLPCPRKPRARHISRRSRLIRRACNRSG